MLWSRRQDDMTDEQLEKFVKERYEERTAFEVGPQIHHTRVSTRAATTRSLPAGFASAAD